MTTVGTYMEYPLTQGRGGLVWTDRTRVDEDRIVAVPVYLETILDNHGSYITTDYPDLTPRMIQYFPETYAVDSNRIYGTSQSTGAMATLYIAAQNPDLYTGILIVDGQWDITTLKGLESRNMFYIAVGDDESASSDQEEVKAILQQDGIPYSEVSDVDAQADASTVDEIVDQLIAEGNVTIQS